MFLANFYDSILNLKNFSCFKKIKQRLNFGVRIHNAKMVVQMNRKKVKDRMVSRYTGYHSPYVSFK